MENKTPTCIGGPACGTPVHRSLYPEYWVADEKRKRLHRYFLRHDGNFHYTRSEPMPSLKVFHVEQGDEKP